MSILSFGAGVNSTALAILLVNRGWRGPILFADTGTEWPETYCHLHTFDAWLNARGLSITHVGAEYREGRVRGGRKQGSLIDYCEQAAMIPTAGLRWCTYSWKTEPIDRWCAKHGETEQLLGISSDEAHRQKGRACPLIDEGLDREACKRLIAAEGLPVPPKSGCYICPFQRKSQFQLLRRLHPDLFERAARLEENNTRARRQKDPNAQRAALYVKGDWTLRELEMQGDLWPDTDDMDAYRPCHCTL